MAKSLGSIIASYRKKNKVSMADFAAACGCSKAYIMQLEHNINPATMKPITPSINMILAAASAMNVESGNLMKQLGVDLGTGLDDNSNKSGPKALSNKAPSPGRYYPITVENVNEALKEGRVLILSTRVPVIGGNVWIPDLEFGDAILHTITDAGDGVFTAYAGSTGYVTFTIFDLGKHVFLSHAEAAQHKEDWQPLSSVMWNIPPQEAYQIGASKKTRKDLEKEALYQKYGEAAKYFDDDD